MFRQLVELASQPNVQPVDHTPAYIGAVAVLSVGLIGWIVQFVVARIAATINRLQLKVAEGQLEVARYNLLIGLLPRRLECHDELDAAIEAREAEIMEADYTRMPYPDVARRRLWLAQRNARLLFSDSVMKHVEAVQEALDEKLQAIVYMRTEEGYSPAMAKVALDAGMAIILGRGEITKAVRESMFVGDIRPPS